MHAGLHIFDLPGWETAQPGHLPLCLAETCHILMHEPSL